jgi:CheY-like chemotaxis protein
MIDDQFQWYSNYSDQLKSEGFQVSHAEDATTALVHFREHYASIDVVTLDLMLPWGESHDPEQPLAGISVFHQLREISPNIPVLVLSNLRREEILDQFVDADCVRVANKREVNPIVMGKILIDLIESSSEPSSTPTSYTDQLENLQPGTDDASRYHNLVYHCLLYIFDDQLKNGRKEQTIQGDTKRVDIVFQNKAKSGFFFDLNFHHKVFCPFIMIECKNYSVDPSNPEIDQLAGRFSDRRGNFGILTCRNVENKARMLERCVQALSKRPEYIIVISDDDLNVLLSLRTSDDRAAINAYMDKLVQDLVMR